MDEGRVSGRSIHIGGIVQGVGFRPFVYNLAQKLGVGGWVMNSSAGVEIVAFATPAALERFVAALGQEAPPLASIDRLTVVPLELPAGIPDIL
ncbi:MAG: hypothetical protein HC802_15510 [Caldilineaceae bacterium]|nr:hypothetical protein [Caldilineaceae bacterium]